MTLPDFAFPVRPGQHACCREDDARDTERLLAAFGLAGLARGHKVVPGFVDVAGMRALRGAEGAALMITAASGTVRRLVALLGRDTDPSVRVPV